MKKKNPNKIWKGEGLRSAAQINVNNHQTITSNLQILTTQKRFFNREWPRNRDTFIHVWNTMSPKAKEDLIRTISPFTPNSPQEPILEIYGKKENVHGACVMFPELCMSELVPGNKLIELMDFRADPSKDELDWIYNDYYAVKSLIERNLVKGNVNRMEKKITFLQPEDRFGQSMDIMVTPPPATMVEWFQKEIIINASTFGTFFMYQSNMYGFLCGILDEIRTEIKNKEGKLPVLLDGCAKCGSQRRKEDPSKSLLFCPCKKVAYCGEECQKAHWKEHKPNHPK